MHQAQVVKRFIKVILLAPVILVLIITSTGLNINYVVTDRKSRQAQAKALHMIQSTNKTIKATWKLMTR